MKRVTIHTDGGCHGNPGPGGWAAVLSCEGHAREVCGAEPATTNNRMELRAAIGALEALKQPCEVELFTDSQYLRQGISGWIYRWQANGWLTSKKEPVRNADLWQQLYELSRRHRIQWRWVRGHNGDAHNERCDQLAAEQIARIK